MLLLSCPKPLPTSTWAETSDAYNTPHTHHAPMFASNGPKMAMPMGTSAFSALSFLSSLPIIEMEEIEIVHYNDCTILHDQEYANCTP